MPKFAGKIGYGSNTEVPPDSGIFKDVITERPCYGNTVNPSRGLRPGETLNPDVFVSTVLSIVADAYARENFADIRYAEWSGVLWTVTTVEIKHPRLELRLGEVYNGPTPAAP